MNPNPHITDLVDVLVDVILRAEIERAPAEEKRPEPESDERLERHVGDGKYINIKSESG